MRVDPLTTLSHGLSDNLEILWGDASGKGGQRRSGDTGMRGQVESSGKLQYLTLHGGGESAQVMQ